jgi:hypothetical protein
MAGVAGAAALNWSGTFLLDMADFGTGTIRGGGVATVNSSHGGIPAHLSTLRLMPSRGHISGSFINIITDPNTAGPNGLGAIKYEDILGGTGTFGGISGGAASTAGLTRGIMPFNGVVKLCLLNSACTQVVSLPFTAPTTVNGVAGTGRKGIGIGGRLTIGGYGGIRMSLQFAPWTIKTITAKDQITTPSGARVFIDLPQKGWAHAPVSTTTSTAQPSGVVQLVTPNQVQTNLPMGSNDEVGSSAMMRIHFIPEPGLLLLLGSAVAGLTLLGRARARR